MAMSSLDALDPATSAVLLVDMQNAFLHPEGTLGVSGVDLADAPSAVARTRELVEACLEQDVPVVWTVQVSLPHDARRARKRLPAHTARRARVAALAGSWDAEIVDELASLAVDPARVVVKHRFGAFYDTRLDTLLGALGVETLLVAGATANACVETTIREAYLRDYDVVALTDCITAVRADWARTAHEIWRHYLGELATSEEVIEWLRTAGRTPVIAKERA